MVLKFDGTLIEIPNEFIRDDLERILADMLENYTWDWDPTATTTSILELNNKEYTVPTVIKSVVQVSADFDPRADFTVDTTYNKVRNIVEKGINSVGVVLKKIETKKPTYDPNALSDKDRKIQGYIGAYQALPFVALIGGIILLQNIK